MARNERTKKINGRRVNHNLDPSNRRLDCVGVGVGTLEQVRGLNSSSNYTENITYSSSGVKWTGSPVNSGGKLAKSRSESSRGLNGGDTCFCSSYTNIVVIVAADITSKIHFARFCKRVGNRKAKEKQ